MPRHLRVEFPGAIYHVTIRGNGRQAIFCDDRDRERLLRRLFESVEVCGVRLCLFCLRKTALVAKAIEEDLRKLSQSRPA